MRKLPTLLFFTLGILALAGCASTKVGQGAVEISSRCDGVYQHYKENTLVGIFTLTSDGRTCHYSYCRDPSGRCSGNMPAHAIASCERRSSKECFVFAVDHRIVWDGPVTFKGEVYDGKRS